MKPMNDVYGIKEVLISLDRVRRNFTTLRTEKKPSQPKNSLSKLKPELATTLTALDRLTNSLLFVIALTHNIKLRRKLWPMKRKLLQDWGSRKLIAC
jgi:hypothetical protein